MDFSFLTSVHTYKNYSTDLNMPPRTGLPKNLDSSLPYNACFNNNAEDMQGESWLPMYGSDHPKGQRLPKKKQAGVIYAVSNYGRIKKISRSGEKIMPQTLTQQNVPRFSISEVEWFTNKIVAKTFEIPNALKLPELGHINGIPWDNRPENLEYCEMNSDSIIFPYTTCNFKLLPTSANYSPICKVSEEGVRLAAYENAKTVGDIRGKKDGYSWIPLREYIRLPRFREQASFVINENNRKHPWIL